MVWIAARPMLMATALARKLEDSRPAGWALLNITDHGCRRQTRLQLRRLVVLTRPSRARYLLAVGEPRLMLQCRAWLQGPRHRRTRWVSVKGTCYSDAYMSTEVAADWHGLMRPWCIMRPSIVRNSKHTCGTERQISRRSGQPQQAFTPYL